MTELLCRLFVGKTDGKMSTKVRSKYGYVATIVGIVVNFLLFGGKLFIGLLFASASVTADAFNNLSDAGSSLISTISFRISMKPADRDHPFGHARMEYIAGMIVSLLILMIGFTLAKDSVVALFSQSEIKLDWYMFPVLGVAILGKVWLYFFYSKIAKKIDSTALRASAADSLSDVMSTSAVLVAGVIIYFTDLFWIDAVVGLIVALLIIYSGVKVFKETIDQILGGGPSEELENQILEIAKQTPEVVDIHDLLVHNYGPGHTVASFHAEVDGHADVFLLHDAIDNLEKAMSDQLGILCTIHMDPIETDDQQVTELKTMVKSVVKSIDERLKIHDFRFVNGVTHKNLIFDLVIPFEITRPTNEVRDEIAAKVKEISPLCNCVITIDRG